jgi:Alcohol dehydrogenase GroES-like domain
MIPFSPPARPIVRYVETETLERSTRPDPSHRSGLSIPAKATIGRVLGGAHTMSVMSTTLELATPKASASATMKALVYHGPGKPAWQDRPSPAIQDSTEAIVRITTSTICGTDLHILKGDLASVTEGRILGHAGIGVIEQISGAPSRQGPTASRTDRSGLFIPGRP